MSYNTGDAITKQIEDLSEQLALLDSDLSINISKKDLAASWTVIGYIGGILCCSSRAGDPNTIYAFERSLACMTSMQKRLAFETDGTVN